MHAEGHNFSAVRWTTLMDLAFFCLREVASAALLKLERINQIEPFMTGI